MERETASINQSIKKLKDNLQDIGRVSEWARLMGYESPKKFARKFLREFEIRPSKAMVYVRTVSIIEALRQENASYFSVAREHSIPDEKGLNNFTNYHLGLPPSELEEMAEERLNQKIEKFRSKIWE